tara:strand:+ start:1174 stop:1314 length:141 start_codon:yes stop_codon:yes gene_type:complete
MLCHKAAKKCQVSIKSGKTLPPIYGVDSKLKNFRNVVEKLLRFLFL